MSVALIAVLSRTIITPVTGEPPYIDQQNSEPMRFERSVLVIDALNAVKRAYPNAIAIEAYVPVTDPLAQARH